MDFISRRHVGWRTILLVQFQPQYVGIILIGTFLTTFYVIKDIALAYSFGPLRFKLSSQQFMLAFDALYFADFLTMATYKSINWSEAKAVFPTRHVVLLLIDFISCVPTCLIYRTIIREPDFTFYILRTRYALRLTRVVRYLVKTRQEVGRNLFLTTFRELVVIIVIFMTFINLVIYMLMVEENFLQTDFILTVYYTICKTTGKGVPLQDATPHKALIPLMIFTFSCYMIFVYYIGAFIHSIIQNMRAKFFYVDSLEKIVTIVLSWKYHGKQILGALQNFYKETWNNRKNLRRKEEFGLVIPEVMAKEITLDVCWNFFQHSHIFRNMEAHYLRYISSLVTVTYMASGELVFKKGKFKSRMVYIMSGVVQLLSEEDGESPILSLSGGSCLGESSLFIDQPSSCTIVCRSFAEFLVLEKRDFFRSHELYPNEFRFILNTIFKRYKEARHYRKISEMQLRNSELDKKCPVITMKWLKKSLTTLASKSKKDDCVTYVSSTLLDDRMFENKSTMLIFCTKYLDMLVISTGVELSTDTFLLKSSCPIIFQPDSTIIHMWNKFVALLSCINCLTYVFYLCLSRRHFTLYSIFIYFLTIVWSLDVYLHAFTAVKTKDVIITAPLEIIVQRLSSIWFFVDILAALPLELLTYIMVGDHLSAQTLHLVQSNRLFKCYRLLSLFDVSKPSTGKIIIILKYLKFVTFLTIFVSNLAGIFYMLMCKDYVCSDHFVEYVHRRYINVNNRIRLLVICYYLSFQFMGGLILGEFPVRASYAFVCAQLGYYFADMYFLSDIAAAETLRNQNKIKYHEFVSNVNFIMKQWNFSGAFKNRVIKYCALQWQFDKGVYILYRGTLFADIPFDLHKIGKHISFGRVIGRIPIFQELPDEILAAICVYAEKNTVPPGEVITYSGEVCKEMYIIEAGYCELTSQSRTTSKILGALESFSVIEACLNVSTVNTVITLTDCKLLSLTYVNFLRSLRFYPQVLAEINNTINAQVNWVAFENSLNRDFLDLESSSEETKSFNRFGYNLNKDSKEYDDFHLPFNRIYATKFLKFVLLRFTITPHGRFILFWEVSRSIFAFFTIILNPITIFSAKTYKPGYCFLIFLDCTAWVDIYLRHHVSYFDKRGLEIKHPLRTASYYWTHGLLLDFLGVVPINIILPFLLGGTTPKTIVYLRITRLFQYFRIHGMFDYYINKTGNTWWIISKYFIMVFVFLNITTSFIINSRCEFDKYNVRSSDMYTYGVVCDRQSWISPNESFKHPISAPRVYAYGLYFMATITTFKGLEGFAVFRFSEIVEIVALIAIWLLLFPYVSAQVIASVMHQNIALVMYQNAMNSLVKFMNYKKIDPVLKTEVIEHFEHIWHKKKGTDERDIFRVFNIALHEDALYHIYGKVMEGSSIFEGASKSFFKSLLLNVRYKIVLKRGLISNVNNVHDNVHFLFNGEVDVLGPDYNYLLSLPIGSVFGHLDNIPMGRQSLTFVAKGHVELLYISSTQFHVILSKYRGIRTQFKNLTAINVDYLINENIVLYNKVQEAEENESIPKKTYRKYRKRCKNCGRKMLVLAKIFQRNTAIVIWEAVVLTFVCYIGSTFELYQKNARDCSIELLCFLYVCDFLFLIKIYLQFHTAYNDDRGLVVTDRKKISQRYLKKGLGFGVDFFSILPFELIALACKNTETKWTVFTYCRFNRLVRIILVTDFFHSINQKLNINVFVMRILYLMVWVTVILQALVYLLFFVARYDPTMEHYNAYLIKNYRVMTYFRQIKVILHMFTGSQIDAYKPNNLFLIILTTMMMIFTRFIIAIFIAETCATLEIVLHNKTNYERRIEVLRASLERESVSPPLSARVRLYVKLLWNHHKGEQFPSLLSEAPYYLREGVLNSMFSFHLRNHPILKNCHRDLIRQMVSCMTTTIFFSGDYLVFQGDIDGCMYFIHEGEVNVLSSDSLHSEIVEKTLKAGDMFGLEQGMYRRCGHKYTYVANTYCVAVLLKRKKWIHLLEFFPASKYLIFDANFEKKLLARHDLSSKTLLVDEPNLPTLSKRTHKPPDISQENKNKAT